MKREMKTKFEIEIEIDQPRPAARPDAVIVTLNGNNIRPQEISDPVETRFAIDQGDDWVLDLSLFDL